MSNVRVLKLISGDEIVAEVGDTMGHELKITKPLALVLGRSQQDGSFTQQILPWALSVKDHVLSISKTHVVFSEEANDELKQVYAEATGSIATPPKGLVMPK